MSNRYPTAKEFLTSPYNPLIEQRFFKALSLPNRTFKTTHERRLDDINVAVWPYISELSSRPLRILDVAASSGISTVEWYEYLSAQGLNFSMTATDMIAKASLLTVGPLAAVVDGNRKFLHVDMAGIGMLTSVNSIRRPMVAVRTALFSALFKIMGGRVTERPIELVSRRFTAHGKIRLLEDDLLASNPSEFVHGFHVIRAANILNLGYFNRTQITQALTNLKERLIQKGLLIVCRSADNGVNNGTIFQLSGTGLVPLKQIGSGSEIQDLASASLPT